MSNSSHIVDVAGIFKLNQMDMMILMFSYCHDEFDCLSNSSE
ncbi:hypothetical protein AB7185_16620 [Providencia rettgeri]